MSFDTLESGRATAKPVTLYMFKGSDTLGGTDLGPYCYTDAEQAIVYGGNTYAPIPIDRDAISSSGTLDNSSLNVRLPADADLCDIFIDWAPSQVMSLFIRQGHADDSEFLVCWTGRVLGKQNVGMQAEFTCEPIATMIRRPGLRRRYQIGCPHVLYGPQCKASKPAATNSATVNTVLSDNRVLMVAGWNTLAVGLKYRGGLMQWSVSGIETIRTILGVNVNQLTLNGPTAGLEDGATVSLSLGCNHRFFQNEDGSLGGDCFLLHDNVLNFGGQWLIPHTNPFRMVNNFG